MLKKSKLFSPHISKYENTFIFWICLQVSINMVVFHPKTIFKSVLYHMMNIALQFKNYDFLV